MGQRKSGKRQIKQEEVASNGEPDLTQLKEDFQDAVQRRDTNIFRRQRLNYEARYCVWANQSRDGRKWTAAKGTKPFPWPGASDARVALVDKYINEDVSFLMVVLDRMRLIVSGTESDDAAYAHRMTNLLRWQKATQMPEYKAELRLAANYMLERGCAVVGVFWDRQSQLGWEVVDREKVFAASMEIQEKVPEAQRTGEQRLLAEFPSMLMDPNREEDAVEALGVAFPGVRKSRLKSALNELRTAGVTRLPRPYLKKNGPTVVALAPNEEIFLPPETTDLQSARVIFRRELLTETQLVDRIATHGWDEGWVKRMLETQRGTLTFDYDSHVMRDGQRVTSAGLLHTDKLFEVIHAYCRKYDDDGVPGIYYTCFSAGIPDAYGYHAMLDYEHGEYPFVLLTRERRSRLLDDARGYGEVAFTWQMQIKAQWDSRIDRASIATLPPSHYPPGEAPDKWGPGVQIPTVRPDDYGFLEIPAYDRGSEEVEESVRRFADEYFGRPVDEQNTVQSTVMRQDLANHWMMGLIQIDTQILKLDQQFMPDEFYFRVVGTSQAKPLKASREEIQGQFDVQVSYNVTDLDSEVVTAKLGLIEKALMMDTTGRVDRNGALEVVFELIDPDIGERILRPALDASQSEIEDEQTVFAKMMSGIDVDVKEGGQAYDLRLQVLQNIFQTNPKAMEQYQSDPRFRELAEKRVKQLTFQLQQRENAIIGRLGA